MTKSSADYGQIRKNYLLLACFLLLYYLILLATQASISAPYLPGRSVVIEPLNCIVLLYYISCTSLLCCGLNCTELY